MNFKELTLTETDFKETSEVALLVKRMDIIDPNDVKRLSNDIFQHQPFFFSLLLGYQQDISVEELEEVSRVYFLVWRYFAENNKLPRKKVTQADFEIAQKRITTMLKYSEAEAKDSRDDIFTNELENLKSKALWTAILLRYNTRPALICMDSENKSMTLIAVLSFIQCFEKDN